jgi:hypothetical protein
MEFRGIIIFSIFLFLLIIIGICRFKYLKKLKTPHRKTQQYKTPQGTTPQRETQNDTVQNDTVQTDTTQNQK